MAQSREDKIFLAYKVTRASLEKQGLTDRIHARTLLHLAQLFSVSPLAIHRLVNERKEK